MSDGPGTSFVGASWSVATPEEPTGIFERSMDGNEAVIVVFGAGGSRSRRAGVGAVGGADEAGAGAAGTEVTDRTSAACSSSERGSVGKPLRLSRMNVNLVEEAVLVEPVGSSAVWPPPQAETRAKVKRERELRARGIFAS